MSEDKTEFDSKLLPVLREGVEIVKMIFFVKLKEWVKKKLSILSQEEQSKIVGAVINEMFGIENPEQKIQDFAKENRLHINNIIEDIPDTFPELLIPLTDALRTAVLCDFHEEGVDTSHVLEKAQQRGLLLVDRDLPMPNRFIELVRRLGSSFGLVVSPVAHSSCCNEESAERIR